MRVMESSCVEWLIFARWDSRFSWFRRYRLCGLNAMSSRCRLGLEFAKSAYLGAGRRIFVVAAGYLRRECREQRGRRRMIGNRCDNGMMI